MLYECFKMNKDISYYLWKSFIVFYEISLHTMKKKNALISLKTNLLNNAQWIFKENYLFDVNIQIIWCMMHYSTSSVKGVNKTLVYKKGECVWSPNVWKDQTHNVDSRATTAQVSVDQDRTDSL